MIFIGDHISIMFHSKTFEREIKDNEKRTQIRFRTLSEMLKPVET